MSLETVPQVTGDTLDQLPRAAFVTPGGYTVQYHQIDVDELLGAGQETCKVCDRPFSLAKKLPRNGHQPVAIRCRHIFCESCVGRRVDIHRNPGLGCYLCTEIDLAYNTLVGSIRTARDPQHHRAAAPTTSLPVAAQEENSRQLAAQTLVEFSQLERTDEGSDLSEGSLPEDLQAAEILMQLNRQDGLSSADPVKWHIAGVQMAAPPRPSMHDGHSQLDYDIAGIECKPKVVKPLRRSKRLARP